MAVKEFRNIFGGVIPKTSKVLATDNTVTAYGTPVALDADGKVTVCAADATAMIGWAISTGAAGEAIDIILAYPGIQALMSETGTYDIDLLEDLVGLAVTDSDFTVDYGDTTNKLFKPKERTSGPDDTHYTWVEVPVTISQAMVES